MLRPHRISHQVISLLMAALLASGCSSWRLQEGPPTTVLESAEKPPDVRLVLRDGQRIKVNNAVVLHDSILGDAPRFRGTGESYSPKKRVAVALADVQSIERRQGNGVATFAVIIVSAGAIALILFAASSAEPGRVSGGASN